MDALSGASEAATPPTVVPEALPLLTPLRRIANPLGDIFHAMKASDDGYAGFGEAYFTTVHCDVVKGWKRHSRMTLNLIVPEGAVRFHVRDDSGRQFNYLLGMSADDGAAMGADYARLTVPPGYWVAFGGVGDGLNLVLNIASIPHDPTEATNVPLTAFPLGDTA